MAEEKWRDIEGHVGRYQVSDQGRVRSLDREDTRGYNIRGKVMKTYTNHSGYYKITLRAKGIRKNYFIARLVALMFIPNPENKPQVNHINEVKTDNRVENLEWMTSKENNTHSYEKITKAIQGANSKPTHMIDKDTGEVLREFESAVKAGEFLGVHPSNITRCARGGRLTAYGYKWEFV